MFTYSTAEPPFNNVSSLCYRSILEYRLGNLHQAHVPPTVAPAVSRREFQYICVYYRLGSCDLGEMLHRVATVSEVDGLVVDVDMLVSPSLVILVSVVLDLAAAVAVAAEQRLNWKHTTVTYSCGTITCCGAVVYEIDATRLLCTRGGDISTTGTVYVTVCMDACIIL